jgi:hypothetical protein
MTARWPEYPDWRGLDAETLRRVAARQGSDFATALVHDRLVRSDEHGSFMRRVAASPEIGPPPAGTLLAIVPGACYHEYPQTGADGRRLSEDAARHGWPVAVVPVASFGRLADNARTICDWLRGRPEPRVVLVSLSKGGADVRTALARPDAAAAFRNVAAWVSLSGIVFGSALASWFLASRFWRTVARLICWRHRYPFAALHEIDRRAGGPLDGELVLPPGLRAVHVVGLPLACHLRSGRARRGYRRVAALGPSDGGGILLGDLCRLPGWVYPVLGADHYLEPDWDIRPLIRRILHAVCDLSFRARPERETINRIREVPAGKESP